MHAKDHIDANVYIGFFSIHSGVETLPQKTYQFHRNLINGREFAHAYVYIYVCAGVLQSKMLVELQRNE